VAGPHGGPERDRACGGVRASFGETAARDRGGADQVELRTARLLQGQRHIGDFTRWKGHNAYSKGLERLLRDLKVELANTLG
jgi:hypothetical protein